MKTAPDHIDELIASYLVGEAMADEVVFLENWKNQSSDNRRYFEQMKLIFEKTASSTSADQFDTDRAWQRLRAKMEGKEGKTVSLNTGYKLLLRIAAGIIVLIAAGVFAYNFFATTAFNTVEVVAENKMATDTLPDGTGVFLNRQTKIEYSFNEATNTHVAKLNGEAYFNIHHDDEKTFIVEAQGTLIRDIGTSFNVKAYADSSTIEVLVEDGEVMFYTEADTGLYLKENETGTYNKETGVFSAGVPQPNMTAYKTKYFSFSSHSLSTVVQTLNGVYEKKIRIDEHLSDCQLTVSFNNENLDEIAEIIAETLGLTVSRSGQEIYLKGPACGNEAP